MFGDEAIKLIKEAEASQATGLLRPYNVETVRAVLLETRQLQAHNDQLIASYPGGKAAGEAAAEVDASLGAQLLTHHLSALRNKRCLLAYHNHRMDFLRRALWDKAGSAQLLLEEGRGSELGALKSRLSAEEVRSIRAYAELLRAYKEQFLDIVDLTAPLHRSGHGAGEGGGEGAGGSAGGRMMMERDVGPPLELMVTIVARRDARDVMTERGTISLRMGERFRVARSEVEGLIVRGWVSVVDE
ncbi:Predicted alpha-helical protein, potentially involved in replication/repair [Ceraceosorus bombacis]|uniref:DNA replication complex GINS protein PSF1 n=1 Tax=Ceraceosorus bombacis TaxID=401625 RepID=A0A0P1BBM6_9BASI|nr:Predicted alpha-helical protein, potentially involved in replication/repair [Ceraceosorus bombacis]